MRSPAPALVWANMMLHAVVDPPALIARWHGLLAVDGFVMFSCLGPGTLRELRELYARRGWPAPTPGFVDMHDLGDMLVRAGFADPVMDQETLTLHLAGCRGAAGRAARARRQRRAGPLRRPAHAALAAAAAATRCGATAGADGRIALSFEIAYGHAFKAAPRPRRRRADRRCRSTTCAAMVRSQAARDDALG